MEWPLDDKISFLSLLFTLYSILEIFAIMAAIHAIMTARTAQGAIAWALSLIAVPFIAFPLYLILSRRKFNGYVEARRVGSHDIHFLGKELLENIQKVKAPIDEDNTSLKVLEKLVKMSVTSGNKAKLLIDGGETFKAIFESIQKAKDYIIIQFYIVRDDKLGQEFKRKLAQKAREGVRVYFLFDEIGSYELSDDFVIEMRKLGIKMYPFHTTKGSTNRFQLNFRNHRKVVIVDGKEAFIGGHNIGEEYLGLSKHFGRWRDTHVQFSGPSVQCAQLAFAEDWHWATKEVLPLNWSIEQNHEGLDALVVPSGPADEFDTCEIFFVEIINMAKKRLWIAGPYFVPSDSVLMALEMAAMRGVDVCLMLPEKVDHILVHLAKFSYFDRMNKAGVKIFFYQDGFLHQKAIVIDDDYSSIGTANLDNRSFRLNFEIVLLFIGQEMAKKVENMLLEDFKSCVEVDMQGIHRKSALFRFAVRLATLMAPVL